MTTGAAPHAVIDIGSNSGRLLVGRLHSGGYVETLLEAQAPLRLARELTSDDRLTREGIDRAVAVCRDFQVLARNAGARRISAVATAAVRRARNRDDLLRRLRRELRLSADVIDGEREGFLSFRGAVQSLPVDSGAVLDVGGGSAEVHIFGNRTSRGGWSFAAGALAMTDRFLNGDPPRNAEIERLRAYIRAELERAEVPGLGEGTLIGTGGTVRNLAKMTRALGAHPIPRIHGCVITRADIGTIVKRLSGMTLVARRGVSGLSSDRADSIVAGAVVVQAVMESLGAREMIVAGHGLREGTLLEELSAPASTAAGVRAASVQTLCARSTSWSAPRARRRSALATQLDDGLYTAITEPLRDAQLLAATVLDLGAGIDVYSRFDRAASICRHADLQGFTHASLARLVAVLDKAGRSKTPLTHYASLLDRGERREIDVAAALLLLADELERRIPARERAAVEVRRVRRHLTLMVPATCLGIPATVLRRVERAVGHELNLEPT